MPSNMNQNNSGTIISNKKKNITVENYSGNVFNESNELLNFSKKSNNKKNGAAEDLGFNKRLSINLKGGKKVNQKQKGYTEFNLKTKDYEYTPYSDSLHKIVNIEESESARTSFGTSLKENTSNSFEDNSGSIYFSTRSLTDFIFSGEINSTNYTVLLNYNDNDIQKKGCKISPFNIYKEITRDIITEFNEKGIDSVVSNSGSSDIRRRTINITDVYFKENKEIEPYDDQGELEDIRNIFKEEKYYEGNIIKTSLVNNVEVLSIDSSAVRYLPLTSKESRFLSNEDNYIEPFIEKDFTVTNIDTYIKKSENRYYIRSSVLRDFFENKDINIMRQLYNSDKRKDVKYLSRGFSNDYSKNCGIESISYRGLVK